MDYYDLINNAEYKLHHRATRRGYISRRKPPKVEEYSGKYGAGYIARLPPATTAAAITLSNIILRRCKNDG